MNEKELITKAKSGDFEAFNELIKAHTDLIYRLALKLTKNQIQLGMCDPFDMHTLDAVERIAGRKVMPALVLEDEFEAFVEAYYYDGEAPQEKAG